MKGRFKRFRTHFQFAAVVMTTGLLTGGSSCTNTGATTLTIFHTNDIHLKLHASRTEPYGLGGLARLKTLADTRRTAHRNNPTLMLDAGDWSEGGMHYTLDTGANILRIMDAIGYNGITVGNHDFLNGPDQLATALEAARPSFSVVAANVDYSGYSGAARLQRLVHPYQLYDFSGLKVAVVGVMTFDYIYASYFTPAKITNPTNALTALTQQLHSQGVQVILLLSHNSFSLNKTLARQVPWVTAVISGHSHYKTPQPEVVRNAGRDVYVVEAKQWGQFLGELNLNIDKQTGTVTLQNYTLHPVTPHLAEDPVVASLVDAEDRRLNAKFGQNVVHDEAAHCRDIAVQSDDRETVLGNMLADTYREALGTDAALEVTSFTGTGVVPGSLTLQNIFEIMPHIYNAQTNRSWTLHRLELSGLELRGLLGLWTAVGQTLGVGSLSLSQIEIQYDPHSTLNPLRSLKIAGSPVEALRLYSLAVHDGLMRVLAIANEKLGMGLNLSRLRDSQLEVWQAVAARLRARPLQALDYIPGRWQRTLDPDLGMAEHDVEIIPRGKNGVVADRVVRVTVHNDGLRESPEAHVSVRFAADSNPVVDGTALERLSIVANSVRIPSLAPGTQVVVDVPWNGTLTPGVHPVVLQFTDNQSFDFNRKNDSVRIHTL